MPDQFVPYTGPVRTVEYVEKFTNDCDKAILIVSSGAKDVGIAVIRCDSRNHPIFRVQRFASLDILFVLEEFRKRAAAALMFAVRRWVKKQKLVYIQFHSYSNNFVIQEVLAKRTLQPVMSTFEIKV